MLDVGFQELEISQIPLLPSGGAVALGATARRQLPLEATKHGALGGEPGDEFGILQPHLPRLDLLQLDPLLLVFKSLVGFIPKAGVGLIKLDQGLFLLLGQHPLGV
jgi:hypothetical protein